MMKLFFFLCILLSFNGLCQNIEVEYIKNIPQKSTNLMSSLQKGVSVSYILKVESKLKKSSYTINEKMSKKVEDTGQLALLAQVFETTLDSLGDIYMKRDSFRNVYKDRKEAQKKIHYRVNDKKEVLFINDLSPLDWVDIDSTKVIANYPCKLAKSTIAGENVYAWYTVDIPIKEGPAEYWGCSGLILQIIEDGMTITAKKISRVSQLNNLDPPSSLKIVSKEEYISFKKNNRSSDSSYRLERVLIK